MNQNNKKGNINYRRPSNTFNPIKLIKNKISDSEQDNKVAKSIIMMKNPKASY